MWPIGTQPRPYLHVDCAGTFFLAIGLPTWTGDFKAVPGLGNGKQARSWGRRGPTFRQLHCGDDHFLLGQYYVEKAFRDVGILAERLGLPLLRKEIAEARYKIPPDLTAVEVLPDDFTFQSSPLQIARDYFDSLQTMTQGRDITGLGIFENILQNRGKITEQLGVEPTRSTFVIVFGKHWASRFPTL